MYPRGRHISEPPVGSDYLSFFQFKCQTLGRQSQSCEIGPNLSFFLQHFMSVPNTHICNESKFVSNMRSKSRFLFRQLQVDSRFYSENLKQNLLTEASYLQRTILGKFCYTLSATTTTNYLFCTSVQDFIRYFPAYFIPLPRPALKWYVIR